MSTPTGLGSTPAGVPRTPRRTLAALWIAFVVVHAGVATLGFVMPNQPMGDVYFVYLPWSSQALAGGGIVGVTLPWVYPPWALLPMLATHALAPLTGVAGYLGYTAGWAVLVTLCDAAAFWMLVGRGRSVGRRAAAWFWLAAVVALGPVALYRIDAMTVPLAVAGALWLVGRPWLGSALLAVATWMKVWPAAVIAAGVVAVRRRGAVLGGALAVTAGTLGIVAVAGGNIGDALSFLGGQTGRGLQLEAPVSAWYLWRAVLRIPGSSIYYDRELVTFQVTGPGIDAVIAVMTPALVLAAAVVLVLGVVKARQGAPFAALFPDLALALVAALIVFNKVGSPQYMTWLTAPVVVGIVLKRRRWRAPATLVLAIGVLTQLEYPLMYDLLLRAGPVAAAVLTARNVLLLVLFAYAVARLVKAPAATRRRAAVVVGGAR